MFPLRYFITNLLNCLVGSKESAYVFALSSAAVSRALARACAQGTITSCSCGIHPKRIRKQFKWSGCSDNVKFANNFGRKFMDAADSAHTNDARFVSISYPIQMDLLLIALFTFTSLH